MIEAEKITTAVKQLVIEACYYLGKDCVRKLQEALDKETAPLPRSILKQIIDNIGIAGEGKYPLCQDTGVAVVFVEWGQDCKITGGGITEAINFGVRQGYREGYLRKSVVGDPLGRENTGDNTPAVIHYDIVSGDRIKITVMPKGAGSENMSGGVMLTPHAGKEAVEEFVIRTVNNAGANACPPVIVGVGIGGTFEKSALLAKKALLRNPGQRNRDPFYAEWEQGLLTRINSLGLGPMGVGGKVTALDVFIETYPCHIASLPVSVNLQCWAARHKTVEL